MSESLYLGRIRGIRIGVNWSLLPISALIAWSLAATLLPNAAPGYATWGYWFFAILTTAAFYASLLAHELAHALVGRRHGVNVKGIVLWIFGGVAQLEGDSPNPRAELELAGAGPAVSVALAAVGLGAAAVLNALGASPLLVASVAWLGGINGLLALFNLLPAFPLDGGRILRALLWRHWGDRVRATATAAKVGRAGGFVLIVIGLFEFLVGGGALGGIWLAVIGWFVVVAAGQQREAYGRLERPAEPRVADAMSRDPVAVPAQATVAEVIGRYVRPTKFSAFPLVDADQRLVGLATVRRMAMLPRDGWSTTPVSAAAAAPPEIVQCRPQDQLSVVATRMQNSADRRAVVLERGRLVGILTPSDAQRAMNRADPFGAPQQAAGRPPGWGPVPQA
jgi:Zn-dependent protease/predicted transcriptional regulator